MAQLSPLDRAGRDKAADAESWRPVARKLLGNLPGAGHCAGNSLDGLIEAARIRKFEGGQLLGLAGEHPPDLGVLLDGLIEESNPLPDGGRQLVAILGPGDLTGLPSLMDEACLGHDLFGKYPCTMALIPMQSARELMLRDRDFCLMLARRLAGINRALAERLAAQGKRGLESRVSLMLQCLSERHGLPGNEGIHIDLKLTQSDLADWVGASRQRINEVLKLLESERIISLRYTALTVLDPVSLRHRARR